MTEKDEDKRIETSGFEAVKLTEKSHAQMEQFRSAHETQVLTILLSDLEGSTLQQHKLGNVRAAKLVQAHRSIFREVLGGFDGQEVETAGDSFLVVFAAPSEAVRFALFMQAAMGKARLHEPELPLVRIGIHQGQVVVERHTEGPKAVDIYGLQVSTAARIMDLGCGGQILCSRAVFDDARVILRGDDLQGLGPVAWRNHGPYRFKGVEDTYDVCEVGEDGVTPLLAPAASTKSWPADNVEEELGWRPAVGVVVPQTNWMLEERLGQERVEGEEGTRKYKGEFGEVWKAWNPSDKSHQVFKFCFRRDRVPALKREARLLKRLLRYRHPNLAEVYDVTQADRPPYYLEMEYVEGPSLEQWLATDPPLKERLEIIAQVADALDTAHAAGIYHRDIKPSNILLTRREDGVLQAKLTDFGLGAAEDEELLKSIYVSRVEGLAGTWDYIAPELRKGAKASPQSDLYSLGVTLYQTAVGDLQRTLGDWERHVESEILRQDIRQCIATDPGQRWRRAAHLAKALRSYEERLQLIRLEHEREERRQRARRLRKILCVVGVLAVVAVATLVYWWRLPGEITLDVSPAGARIEIAGRVLTVEDQPISLRLQAGYYEARFSADDHFTETREVVIKRGQHKQLSLPLGHHYGLLDVECEPAGSEIRVDGVAYGSRIRNLRLNTGQHRLLAWSNNRFQSERAIEVRQGQHVTERFWLDAGAHWMYKSMAIQGAAYFVADVDGDGVSDIAQNELSQVAILSGASGKILPYRLSAPGSGARSFREIDLGGDVGSVIAAAKEDSSMFGLLGGLDVFVIRKASPTRFLWRWSGPRRDWKEPAGASLCVVDDLNEDGVSELAVGSRDGQIYILDGRTGSTHKEIVISGRSLKHAPSFTPLGAHVTSQLVYLVPLDEAQAETGARSGSYLAGCLQIKDGSTVWQKHLSRVDGVLSRDLDGDGLVELVLWQGNGWQVLDGSTGQMRQQVVLAEGQLLPECRLMTDLDGDGSLEFLLVFPDPSRKILAVRLSDGSRLWEGPTHVRTDQPLSPGGLLRRAPGGEVLVALDQALVALDPHTGTVVWQIKGRPEGLLVGDWEGDGQDEIFLTIQGLGLVCLDATGQRRWTLRLDVDARPFALVPDIDGDGLAEILIHQHAALYGMVRGPRVLWSQSSAGPLQATPLILDTEDDGRPEVVQLGPWGHDQHLRCLEGASGAVRWSTPCLLPSNRTLAVADWDGDSRIDVIGICNLPGSSDAQLVVFRAADGKLLRSITVRDHRDMYSIPVAVDLNGDGALDLATHRWGRQDIIAIDGKTGVLMWRHPTKGPNMGGVGACDLDGDGLPDIVAPSLDGYVYALGGTEGKQLWEPVAIGLGGSRSPPLLEDITGDGKSDVLVITQKGVMYIIDGGTGETVWIATVPGATEGLGRPAYAKIGDKPVILAPLGNAGAVAFDVAKRAPVWQSAPRHPVLATPVVADLDRDGIREVVVGSTDGQLLILDLASGDLLWKVQVSDELIEADPAVIDIDADGILDILIADHSFKLTGISGLSTIGARKRWHELRARRP